MDRILKYDLAGHWVYKTSTSNQQWRHSWTGGPRIDLWWENAGQNSEPKEPSCSFKGCCLTSKILVTLTRQIPKRVLAKSSYRFYLQAQTWNVELLAKILCSYLLWARWCAHPTLVCSNNPLKRKLKKQIFERAAIVSNCTPTCTILNRTPQILHTALKLALSVRLWTMSVFVQTRYYAVQ